MDPQTGRFTARDPFGGSSSDPKSIHRFVYAADDPISMGDPSGEIAVALATLGVIVTIMSVLGTAYSAHAESGATSLENQPNLSAEVCVRQLGTETSAVLGTKLGHCFLRALLKGAVVNVYELGPVVVEHWYPPVSG